MSAPSTLVGTRVLVTGADGFIGSHVVDRLAREGAAVRAFCWYNSNGSYGWLDELEPDLAAGVDFVLGDVTDAGSVDAAVRGVDVVLHLAALIAVPYSYAVPRSFIDTNVIGTFNVLQSALQRDVQRVVQTSTSEVYGTPDNVPIVESHPLRAQSPYSATKIAADKLAEAWACTYGLPVTILRPFNTYGPRQSLRAVIPTILGQLLAGERKVRLGSLSPRRDFTYVTDTADGFARAATAAVAPGQVIQLGTGSTISIGDLLATAASVLGVECEPLEEAERIRPERSEVLVLQSDPTAAREQLGWEPLVSIEQGLQATAEWLAPRISRERAVRYQR